MSKIGIIIKREYLRRVSKKSFLLLTFLTPLLFVALIFGTFFLSSVKSNDTRNIAVIDQTGEYFKLFKNFDNYVFVDTNQDLADFQKDGTGNYYAIVNITGNLLEAPSNIGIYSNKQIPSDLKGYISNTLNSYLTDLKLESYNIPNLKQIIADSKIRVDIQTIKWGGDGSIQKSSTEIASGIGIAFTFFIYLFIMLYGAMVMQGVIEEKTSRIIEIIISSVKPFDLMMGKIIGIGLVGITQMILWAILSLALMLVGQTVVASGGEAVSNTGVFDFISSSLSAINLPLISFMFILFFIGGYGLYASIFSAIGAAVDSQEDTQQFMTPVTILMLFAFYAGMYSMENPDGPLAFWGSLFPLTSPIVMMVRLPFDVPLWQIGLSLTLLFATFILMVKLSGKIYRVGILMYGKKPSIKEIIKWIQYK
ncbi:MAG TPA: ABC transporter permease [Porphyromonadaceae bacterium]|nr:ABC transporter permease [Porphyromonadaceae bacterium]